MKKLIITYSLFLCSSILFAQTKDYRTSEDGLTKLINNPDFINDVVNLGKENLTLENLDSYFTKYVPEYSNFKIDKTKINFDNMYYVNSEGVTNDFVANQLAGLLKLNSGQAENLKNIFTGNIKYTPTNSFSAGYGNLLFERGKDVKVDFAVDFAVDFFQSKLGDGGINSALIDIGGGILGGLLSDMNKEDKAKLAQEAFLAKKLDDFNFYNGKTFAFISTTKGDIPHTKDQADLYLHYKANKKLPNNCYFITEGINYDEAITLLNEAIILYKQNPERASYLYSAYVSRGQCKMQKGAYRAAIIDYYYAEQILEKILNNKLPDNFIKTKYPIGYWDYKNKKTFTKGEVITTLGLLTQKDMVAIIRNRAFAKYRLSDYKGAIADCKLAMAVLVKNSIPESGKPNDYKDIIKAIIAMSQFGLESYQDSYITFYNANLTDDIIADNDNDGLCNLMDMDTDGLPDMEGAKKHEYYGMPNYFPFDISQIKGLCSSKANKIEDAIATYEKLELSERFRKMFTNIGGDISSVYSTLGSFYYKSGDKTKAISLLDKAILLNPYQLDYYYKRGTYKKALGQIVEANLDFKIVKSPESIKSSKKSVEYYYTKYTKYISEANHAEVYNILKEALIDYPENQLFFNFTIDNLIKSKNKSEAKEFAKLRSKQDIKYHLLLSLNYEFSQDMQGAEKETQLAFENGLGLYEFNIFYYYLKLKQKPYYFKLFLKYATKTNNNFIKKNLNDTEKSAIIANNIQIDSLAAIEIKKLGINQKFLKKNGLAMQNAKETGNIEEYLSLLNKIKELTYDEVIDKIECLIILGNKKEAHDFAKKVINKGLIENLDIYDTGGPLQNFASESFAW
jgi:tetratricopeptide (TPR) repeat protein